MTPAPAAPCGSTGATSTRCSPCWATRRASASFRRWRGPTARRFPSRSSASASASGTRGVQLPPREARRLVRPVDRRVVHARVRRPPRRRRADRRHLHGDRLGRSHRRGRAVSGVRRPARARLRRRARADPLYRLWRVPQRVRLPAGDAPPVRPRGAPGRGRPLAPVDVRARRRRVLPELRRPGGQPARRRLPHGRRDRGTGPTPAGRTTGATRTDGPMREPIRFPRRLRLPALRRRVQRPAVRRRAGRGATARDRRARRRRRGRRAEL